MARQRLFFCCEKKNLIFFELIQKPLSKYMQTMIAYSPPKLRMKV
jgi:hypothetical protein